MQLRVPVLQQDASPLVDGPAPQGTVLSLQQLRSKAAGVAMSLIRRCLRWYASLPLAMVATHSLLAGLVLSAMEAAGWIHWGHEGLLLALLPILGWMVACWWVERE